MHRYHCIKEIGRGTFGRVYSAIDIPKGHKVAIKVIDNINDDMDHEYFIGRNIIHPNVIKYHDIIYDYNNGTTNIIQDYLTGKDLFDYRQARKSMTEPEIKSIVLDVIDAVQGCQEQGVSHLDIKMENFVLNEVTNKWSLIDFGGAHHLPDSRQILIPLFRTVGSKNYASPEVLDRIGFCYTSDIWSIGALAHTMFYQYFPMKVMGEYCNSSEYLISKEFQHFLRSCMSYEWQNRPFIGDLRNFPWISDEKK